MGCSNSNEALPEGSSKINSQVQQVNKNVQQEAQQVNKNVQQEAQQINTNVQQVVSVNMNTADSIKENYKKKIEVNIDKKKIELDNQKKNIEKNVENINKPISVDYNNLPNYDLFEKFIKLKKVKEFIETNVNGGYEEIITGIYDEIKPLVDELFKRFKIEYEIISKAKTFDCHSYRVDIRPVESSKNADNYFPLFFLNFWFYPPEVFQNRVIKKFYFCQELLITTSSYSQPRAACPEWTYQCMLYRMQFDPHNYLTEVMHHELFHYFDFMVSGSRVDRQIENDWSKLNPKGFSYGSGGEYEREYMNIDDKDKKSFVTHYSMSQCCEDRAETYCRVMTRNTKWYNKQSKTIINKINKIKDFMRRHDPNYIGNKNNCYYERLQNFLDRFYKFNDQD
jgi:F0F1-type ATP synthase membrane subunit b/b'